MSFLSKLKYTASSIALFSAVFVSNVVEAYNSYITPNIYISSDNKLHIEGNTKKSSSNFKWLWLGGLSGVELTGTTNSKGKLEKPTFTLNSSVLKDDMGNTCFYDPDDKITVHNAGFVNIYDDYYNVREYANQINGDITIEDASLIVNKELAANNININTGGTLTTNALIHSNINVDGYKAKANINASRLYLLLNNVSVRYGGELTFSNPYYMGTTGINVDYGTLNYAKRGWDYETPIISVDGGVLNADNWIIAVGENINIENGSTVTLKDTVLSSEVLDIGTTVNYGTLNNKITLGKTSLLNGYKGANISISDIILNNNAKIGSMKETFYVDYRGNIIGWNLGYLGVDTNVNIDSSNIALNNSSSIENSFVIMQDTKSEYTKVYDYLTPDLMTDEMIDYYEYYYDFSLDLDSIKSWVKSIDGDIDINRSNITMNGTSQIANRLWKATSDLNVTDQSTITTKGKNKLIAGGYVNINDSVLDVTKGSTLSVESYDNAIHFNHSESANSTLNLAGTLNANVKGKLDTLILGKSGKLNGYAQLEQTPINFGVSGVTSEKDLNNLYVKYVTQWNGQGGNGFWIADKSKVTLTNYLYNGMGFKDIWVDNSSTLTTKAGEQLNMNGGIFVENMSTLNISNGTKLTAEAINTHASNVNINGSALKKGETEYQTKINADTFAIGNIDNPKAKVNIKNAEINLDDQMRIVNAKTSNLTNVDLNGNFMVASKGVAMEKGKYIYNTTTLKNVKVDGEITVQNNKLVINDSVKADKLVASDTAYSPYTDSTYIDIKGNNVKIAQTDLQDEATLAIASGKTFDSEFSLGEQAKILLNGNLSGTVIGEGTLEVQNAKSKVDATIDGIKLAFGRIKAGLQSVFGNSTIGNLSSMTLNGSTITADKDMGNVGDLTMSKASLTLGTDVLATNADINSSKLYLGTNTLDIDGVANISNKSSIFLNVADNDTYGKIRANHIDLSDNTTSMAVTLNKGVDLSSGGYFTFLDYDTVNGELGKVTVANNRYKFTEVGVGQFVAEESSTGKGVIERFDASKQNLAIAAMYLVDDRSSTTSTSEVLNTLSQQVGGEKSYASALETVNADDTGLVQNTSNEVSQTVTNAAMSQMTGGNSNAIQGMSSGDMLNGGSMWVKTLYNHAELDKTSKYNGFTGNTTGIAFGGDKMVSDDVKVGLGYGYTQSRVKNDIRTSDVDTHTLMLYGEYKPSQWFVNGVFSYGWSDYSQKASNGIVSVKSDFDVYAAALLLNTGYEARVSKSTVVTPYVGMRYLNVDQDSYVDSDNKHIATDKSDLLTLTASTKVKTDFELDDNTTITPEARFGVTYDVVSDGANSIVSLSNGASYEVESRRLDRFGVELGAGVSAHVNDNWEITAGYEGKFKQDYQDHTGTFDIKYNF